MLKLTVTVITIALADCINPSLIGGELFVALGSHPRRATIAYTIGALTVTVLVGLALALGLGDLVLSVLPKPGPTVKYALISAAGAVLIAGGIVIWIRRAALTDSAPSQHRSHGPSALIGAGVAGVELLTAFPYFAAIALIIGSNISDGSKLALLILYCVVYTLPLIVIAVATIVLGKRTEKTLLPLSEWLSAHWPAVVAPLTAAIGVGLLVFGIIQLT